MDIPNQIITESAEDTQGVGESVGHTLITQEGSPRVLCMWGELGSGKTTFVQGLARGMGITARLLSPTFIIVRRYDIPQQNGMLYHLDLYRMKSEREVEGVGFSDMLADPSGRIVIEWPERLGALLPVRRLDLKFAALDNGTHEIRITEAGI